MNTLLERMYRPGLIPSLLLIQTEHKFVMVIILKQEYTLPNMRLKGLIFKLYEIIN